MRTSELQTVQNGFTTRLQKGKPFEALDFTMLDL